MGRIGSFPIGGLILFATLGGGLASTTAFAGEISVQIEFDQYYDRISPDEKMTTTHEVITVTINSNKAISHTEHHYDGKGREKIVLNEDSQLGQNNKIEWKVVNKTSLINIFEYKSFRRAILVTVTGNTCTAQVDFELKPGFSDYEYKMGSFRLPAVARSASADNFQCTITSTQPN